MNRSDFVPSALDCDRSIGVLTSLVAPKRSPKSVSRGFRWPIEWVFVAIWLMLLGPGFVCQQLNGQPPDPQQAGTAKPDSTDLKLNNDWKAKIRPLIESHCLDCHASDVAEGGIDLGKFDSAESSYQDLKTWHRALKAIESQSMPPSDGAPLEEPQRKLLSAWILDAIQQGSRDAPPQGRVRRLTRIEYENTIRDLFRLSRNCFNNPSRILKTDDYFDPASSKLPRYVFAVNYIYHSQYRFSDLPDVGSLPVDPPVEHGFANDQTALSISPLLMEVYFKIADDLLHSEGFATISRLWRPLFTVPDDLDDAKLIKTANRRLATFLERAFRRPVGSAELQRYQKLFQIEYASEQDFTAAMQTTVAAILVSPSFLLRSEFAAPSSDPVALDPEEATLRKNFSIANRLSYFLWATMPDETLLQAAREGRLTDKREIRRQVRRMLKDKRIKSLATQFGMQWLKTHKVASVRPDKDVYPEYYVDQNKRPSIAVSMITEQLLLFEAIMVENRSIQDFVKADFTYVNRQLMDWYYLNPKEVLGYTPPKDSYEDFFRVQWPQGHRGGVITSGAMLVSTSTTTRTSPVYRGAWIMDVIFNAPPPAPPANVPALESSKAEHAKTPINVRERLRQHREDPTCATCHDRIDPFGFALENFDALGRWRSKYRNDQPVDSSTEFLGNQFRGVATLKNMIRREKTSFTQAFCGHMMKYALGRDLDYADEPELRQIANEVLQADCRFHAVVEAVATSDRFLMVD